MRIIAGEWKGRRISAPEGHDVRPTTDKVREAIFGSIGPRIVDASVLDVFGGSGAFGMEAASRGAKRVVIIENNRRAQNQIQANLKLLRDPDMIRLMRASYTQAMRELAGGDPFDIVFMDPPYESNQYTPALQALEDNELVAPEALVILESNCAIEPEVSNFRVTRSKRYGSVYISYGAFDDE